MKYKPIRDTCHRVIRYIRDKSTTKRDYIKKKTSVLKIVTQSGLTRLPLLFVIMKLVVVLAVLIAVSYGQTHHPHTGTGPTHEPNVHEFFNFFYDFHTHKMMVTNHQNCYIFTLSDQEKVDVHTDSGLTALELKLLPMVDSATKTEVQKSSLEASVVHACGQNVKHYYTMS